MESGKTIVGILSIDIFVCFQQHLQRVLIFILYRDNQRGFAGRVFGIWIGTVGQQELDTFNVVFLQREMYWKLSSSIFKIRICMAIQEELEDRKISKLQT